MERVTGIGGIFIRAKDPKSMAAWYQKYLGIGFDGNTYVSFRWINQNDPGVAGTSVFSFFENETKYFQPSRSSFMINFRVKDLSELLKVLQEEGVTIAGDMMEEVYGKFAWIMDPEGNKIELWEPYDEKM